MKKTRQRQIWETVLLATAAGVILMGSLGLCLFPSPRFSAIENRYLAQFPALCKASLADGSYTAALDTYAAERLPFRYQFRGVRALSKLVEGNCEVNGVLLCRDGSLAQRFTVNQRAFEQNLKAMKKISDFFDAKNLPCVLAVAPRRIDARTEVLPRIYDPNENTVVWDQLQATLPNAVTFSNLTADAHWYRTDHHWTTRGAYTAYCALSSRLPYAPCLWDSFDPQPVSKSFLGTAHSAAGIPFLTPDTIELYRYENDTAFTILLDGKQAPFAGFYDLDKLQTKDGYGVFLGGNYGHLEIKSGTDRPTLLLIKDSFANSMIPFLAQHFDIVAIDPRYTSADLSLISCDAALLLCGMQTLCESAVLRQLTI